MTQSCLPLLLTLSLFQASCANGVSPVQKVVQMIDAMAVKVQKDLDKTSLTFEEFAKYCDDESHAKEYAIKDSNEKLEQLQAVIEESNAKISDAESRVQDASAKISEQEAELHESKQLRAKEHEQFLSTEKDFLEMAESLAGAKKAFATPAAFMQLTPESKVNLDKIIGSIKAVVESSFVTHAQRKEVQAFLQAREDAQDSLTLGSKNDNEATLQLLSQLEEFAMDTLSATRKKEQEGAHAHAMLVQGLESEIESLNEELQTATGDKHYSSEMLAEAQKDQAVETKSMQEDQAAAADLKVDCQKRAQEFEAESKDANGELGALAKAKEILTKKFSLIQTQRIAKSQPSDNNEDAKARALRQIQQLGKKFHSTSLITLAYRASASPFAKVTGMVEDMIAKLEQQAAEEATQKAFCDKEMGTSQKSKAEKEASIAKTSARIDKANSAVAKLSEGVQVLSKEIADLDSGMAEAASIRQAEKTEFVKVEKDYSESEEACAAAIQALREYYEGASLVEVSAHSGMQATRGEGIIGLLEVAESDFAKLLAEARTVEETAAADYETLTQEQKMAKATKEVDVKGKRSELKSVNTALANYNGDKEGVSAELDAVVAYLAELKPQCETEVETYAERKAARESEITGLKDALNILSGDGIAFMQVGRRLRRVHA